MTGIAKSLLAVIVGALLGSSCAFAADTQPSGQSTNPPSDTLKVGDKAPDFTRTTSNGKKVSLKQFRNKTPVVLYFYPKDETPNCIKEACGFRDFFHKMENKDAEIIGVSGDTDESHKAFIEHYTLPFDIISDTDNSLLNLYHVPFFKGSLHKRVTFIINKKGVITNVIEYTNDGDVHVREATEALKMLGK